MTMKKTILLLLALLLSFAVSACSNSSEANFEVTDVAVSYGKPIELAKEEFETIFSGLEGLEITETVTLSRTAKQQISSCRSPIHRITVTACTALSLQRMRMGTGKSCRKASMLR